MAKIQFNFVNDEGQTPTLPFTIDQNIDLPDDEQLRFIGNAIVESGWIPRGFFAQGYRFVSADVYRETVRNIPAVPVDDPPEELPVEPLGAQAQAEEGGAPVE